MKGDAADCGTPKKAEDTRRCVTVDATSSSDVSVVVATPPSANVSRVGFNRVVCWFMNIHAPLFINGHFLYVQLRPLLSMGIVLVS